MSMFDDEPLPWSPFGLELTYKEWDELLTWYVQKQISERLDTKEVKDNAVKLYP
jgi:hypothetical protein